MLNLTPQEPGDGYVFENKIVGGAIPKEYIPAVDKGIQEAIDVRRPRRLPGRRHQGQARRRLATTRSTRSEMAFKIAGSMGIKEALRKSGPVLLEPMMEVEVNTPEEFMGDVMGDLSSRRGHIEGMEPRGNAQIIRAKVPLSEMFGYATDLRSRTQGRASYTMQFKAYEQVPKSIAEEIVSKSQGEYVRQ